MFSLSAPHCATTPSPTSLVAPPLPSHFHSDYNNKMADSEVATRAPESDAQEETQPKGDGEAISGIEGDTKPDQGAASMGVSPTGMA